MSSAMMGMRNPETLPTPTYAALLSQPFRLKANVTGSPIPMLALRMMTTEPTSGSTASQSVAPMLPGPLIPSGSEETAKIRVKTSRGAALTKLPANTDLPKAHIASV